MPPCGKNELFEKFLHFPNFTELMIDDIVYDNSSILTILIYKDFTAG